jgi:hypothetical protein
MIFTGFEIFFVLVENFQFWRFFVVVCFGNSALDPFGRTMMKKPKIENLGFHSRALFPILDLAFSLGELGPP